MKLHGIIGLLTAVLPLASAAEKPRAMFGVVADDALEPGAGMLVLAVHPASPARQAGVQEGDILLSLNGQAVRTRREMRQIIMGMNPGDVLQVELLQGKERKSLQIVLGARPPRRHIAKTDPHEAVGGDRQVRPLRVAPEIRRAMREHRAAVVSQLAALPDGFVPAQVTEHLQAIRHLARDANRNGRGWMLGEAGEVTLQFKDGKGILVLHGANKLLTLTVYGADGNATQTLPLNTPADFTAVPAELRVRLRALR